jgi:dCMP deaminase
MAVEKFNPTELIDNKDEYFMALAIAVSKNSHDPSSQVGCVIVNPDGKVIATGTNDFHDNYEFNTVASFNKDGE